MPHEMTCVLLLIIRLYVMQLPLTSASLSLSHTHIMTSLGATRTPTK